MKSIHSFIIIIYFRHNFEFMISESILLSLNRPPVEIIKTVNVYLCVYFVHLFVNVSECV